MPLGITESTIRRAYAPLDLSGVYKSIENIEKYNLELEKAQRLLMQKDYYTSLAGLTKDVSGIRAADNAEIMSNVNRWKSLSKRLMLNQDLINTNPELYGQLNAEANAAFTAATELSNKSKAKKEYHKKLAQAAMANPNKFTEDALAKISTLDRYSTSQLENNLLDDMDTLVYQGPDFNKVNEQFSKISKTPKTMARVIDFVDPKYGATVYTDYEIPDIKGLQNSITNTLSAYSNRDKESIVERVGQDYNTVRTMYQNLPDSYFEKFKTDDGSDKFPLHASPFTGKETRKPDINFDATSYDGKLNAYLLAKNILGVDPVPAKGKEMLTKFDKGELGKRQMINDLRLQLERKLSPILSMRKREGIKIQKEEGVLDAETKMLFRLLTSIVAKPVIRDISAYEDLTPEKMDELLKQLGEVSEKTKELVKPTKPTVGETWADRQKAKLKK